MSSHAGADIEQADLDFNAGFTLEAPVTATPPAKTEVPAKVETKPTVEAKTATPPKPDQQAVPPKYRRITEDEFATLQAAASNSVTADKVKDIVLGSMGNLEQRIVGKLQASTPRGMTIDLPDDVVSEMEKDFPELAGHFKTALEKALKGRVGTGPASATGADPEVLGKLVDQGIVKLQIEALEDAHPKWREIVGAVDSEGKFDPNNGYRKWLGKQDAATQHRINTTNNAVIISRSIDRYLDAQKALKNPQTPAPKIAARKDRIAAAITPRGDGGQPAPSKTAEDDFEKGFATG